VRQVVLDVSGTVICARCAVAETAFARARGLIGRPRLERGEGLLLVPCRSVHTGFTRFPIDVVFLDREMRVLRAVPELPPWRIAGCRRARAVLELAAGEWARRGLRCGARLALATGMR
jgi:uncharacterized membrane protein (UPF0127 family)